MKEWPTITNRMSLHFWMKKININVRPAWNRTKSCIVLEIEIIVEEANFLNNVL